MRCRPVTTPRPLASSLARFSSAAAMLAALAMAGSASANAAAFQWDPNGNTDIGATGGAGIWDATSLFWFDGINNVAWPNITTASAIFKGTPGRVTINNGALGVQANALSFDVGGYLIDSASVSDVLALGGTSPTVTITNAADSATINATLSGTSGFTKSGLGTLILGADNFLSLSGPVALNQGLISLTNLNGLGVDVTTVGSSGTLELNAAAAGNLGSSVILNGGTLVQKPSNQVTLQGATNLSITANGGTVNILAAGPGGKVLVNGGLISGPAGATLNKTGNGDLQVAGANLSMLSNVNVTGGQLELQNVNALGGASGGTITVGGSGEVVTSGVAIPNAITLNTGGMLSANSSGGGDFQGAISVNGNANVALRAFHIPTSPNNLKISGTLSGTGGLNITAPAPTSTAVSSLLLTGNNAAYTGTISAGPNTQVRALQGTGADGLGSASITLSGGTLGIAPVITAAGATAGFQGRYYIGTNPSATTSISNGVIGGYDFGLTATPGATRTDTTINFSDFTQAAQRPSGFSPASNANFGILWTGILNVANGGAYSFSTTSDDGSLLYVDGQPVVLSDFSQGATTRSGTINLPSGFHSVVVKYGQGTGGTSMVANYSGPDTGNATALLGSVAGSVTNNGAIIQGSSTIDNNITLSAGTTSAIDLSATNATSTGTITFGSGARLNVTGLTGSETLTQQGNVTLNGANVLAAGNIQVTNNLQNQSAGADIVITGAIGEATPGSSLIKVGPHNLTLSATNTYTGVTSFTGGTLLSLNASGGNAIPGDLILNPYAISGVSMSAKAFADNQIKDNAIVTLLGYSGITGSNLDLNGFNDTIGGVNFVNNQGSGAETVSTGAGTLTLNGNVNMSGTSTGANSFTGNLNLGGATRTFTTSGLGTGSIGAVVSNGGITKAGLGALTLAGANTYAGLTTVNAGKLTVSNAAALGATTAGGETVVNAGGYLDIANVTIAEPITLNGRGQPNLANNGVNNFGLNYTGALQGSGGFNAVASGPITLASNAAVGAAPGSVLTISGVISDGGSAFSLTKTQGNAAAVISTSATSGGPGIVKLTGINTYTGPTIVEAGDLWLASSGQTLASKSVVIGTGVSDATLTAVGTNNQFASGTILTFNGGSKNAKFQLNGTTQTVAGFDVSGSLPIIQNHESAAAGAGTLIVDNPTDTSFNGLIRDQNSTLALTKQNGGTLTLSGNGVFGTAGAIYTGTTTVNAGKLVLQDETGFNSPITLTGTGSLEFNYSYGRSLVYSKALTDGGLGFTKTGAGNLTISGIGTVTGPINVNGGVLNLTDATGNVNPLAGAPINVAAGAQLQLFGVTAVTTTFNNNVTLNGMTPGGAFVGAVVTGTPINNLTGSLTLNATSNISADKTFTISGKISGPGGLVIDKLLYTQNPGVFNITNTANDYAGGTTINTGTVAFATGALPASGNLKFGGTFGNGGNVGVGQLVLGTGGLSGFGRTIGTGDGQVQFTGDGGGFTAIGSAQTVSFGNTGPLDWKGTGVTGLDANASLVFNTGTGANNEVVVTNDINLNGGVRRIVTGASSSRFTGIISGTSELIFDGAGTHNLSGANANTYTGLTNVSGGTLVLAKTGGNAINGDIQISNNQGGTRRVVYLNANDQIADTATISFIGSNANNGDLRLFGFNETVAGINDRSGGGIIEVVEAETATNTLTLAGQNANGSTLTIKGDSDSFYNGFLRNRGTGSYTGTLALVKDGAGTLTISQGQQSGAGNASYGGATTINAGKLVLANLTTFNSAPTVASGAALEFAENINQNATFGQVISGAGSVLKSGPGTMVLSAANTFTGAVTINGGTLQVGNGTTGGALADNAIIVNAGGTLAFSRNNALTHAGVISGAGNVESRTAGGVITLSGANTYTGATIANAGTLVLSGTNISSGGLVANNGGVITLDFSSANSAATNLVASGSQVALGGGTLNIAGSAVANSQTLGNVTLNPGASTISLSPGAGNLQVNIGNVVRAPGGIVNLVIPAGSTLTTTSPGQGGILGGFATTDNGTNWVARNGAGVLSALATYTSDTWDGSNVDVTTNSTQTSGVTANSLRFNTAGATSVTLAGTNTLSTGGILVTPAVGANASSITGGTLRTAAGTDFTVIQGNTAGSLTIGSVLADNGGATGLAKNGAGTLILTGANTYTGNTTVQQGTLISLGSLGSGLANVASGATLQIGDGTTTGVLPNFGTNFGNVTIATGTTPQVLSTPFNAGANYNFLTNALGSSTSSQTGVFTKAGSGVLTITAPVLTNQFHQRAGTTVLDTGANVTVNNYNSIGQVSGDTATLVMKGASRLTETNDFNVGDNGGTVGILNIQDAAVLNATNFYVGKFGNAAGVVNQSGVSTVNWTGSSDKRFGGSGGTVDKDAYGAYQLSAGTLSGAGNFQPGAYGNGVYTQNGGAATFASWITPGRYTGGYGVMNITGGTLTQNTNRVIVGENGTGVLNVGVSSNSVPAYSAGQMFLLGGLSSGNTGGDGNTNLWYGGLINTATVGDHNANTDDGKSVFNFHGGILQARAASTAFFGGGTAASNNGNMTNAFVWPEGASIDSNSFAITVNQPLVAPTGNGLATIALTNGGSGYQAEPVVKITGGGGTGATARAIISNGVITGFQITNPGVGYTSEPTITLVGGVPSVAAVAGATTIAANATTGGLTKLGTGALTLNTASTYGGATNIVGGSITLDFSAATAPATNSNILPATELVLNGGGLSVTGKASTTNSQTFSAVTVNAPGSIAATIGTSGTVNLTLGAINRNAGGAINFTLPATGAIQTTTVNTGTSILGGWATVAGANWAVSGATATAAGNITALSSYTTDTWASDKNTDVTSGGGNPLSGATTNSLRFNAATAKTLQLTGTSTINTGGILVTPTVAGNATTITGGTLATGSNTDLIVNQYNTGTLTIASIIAANGTGGLVKAGGGVLVLNAAANTNTYSGNTVIGAGTLRLGTANQIPDGANKGNVVIHAGASLDLANLAETINGLSGYGSVVNSVAGTPTLTVGGNNASSTFSGTIVNGTGNVALTKTGTGTLTLNNVVAGSFTGGTTISAGAIKLATPNALSNNTTITVNSANGLLFDTTIPTISGLAGNATFALQTTATSAVPNAPVQLTLGANNAGATYSGALTGSGTVIKIGTGTQTLSGANTHTGGVVVNAGTLILSGNNSGASGLMVANSGSVLQFASGNSIIGSGRNLVVNTGGTVSFNVPSANPASTGFGSISAALSRIDQNSTGFLALLGDASVQAPITENLDFSAAGPGGGLNLSLGAALTGTGGLGNTPVVYTGVITPNAKTFRLGGNGRLILPNGATLGGANDLNIGGSGGSGLLFLTGAYGFTGSTVINAGPTTLINTLANGGVASSLGAASSAASNLILNGGALQYVGTGSSTDRLFTLGTSPGALDSSGTGPVNFTNTSALEFLNSGNRTLTLQGNNTALNSIAAAIGDSINVAGASGVLASGTTAITKGGNGTWFLSGANTFSGGVTINNGVLGFASPAAIGSNTVNGPASVFINSGGAAALGAGFTGTVQTALNRISPLSTGTVALTTDTAENLNFDGGAAGATLPTAFLGAYGNVNYTGSLTPFGNTYRLGGGGGVLTMPNGGLTGPRTVVIGGGGPGSSFVNSPNLNGAVVLGGSSDYSGGTILNAGAILSATNLAALGTGPLKFQGGFYRAIDTTDITLASDGVSAREIRFGTDASANSQTANVDVVSGVNLSFSKTFGPAATLGSNLGQQNFTKWGGGSLTLANGINLGTSSGTNNVATNSGTLTIERGTLSILSNPTNFNGLIQVGSNNGGVGTLKLGANNVFGNTTAAFGSGSIIDTYTGSKIDLAGFSDTIRMVRGMGTIVNTGASSANLTVNTANENAIFGGNLVGNFTLTKGGTVTNLFGTGATINSLELYNNNNSQFTGKFVVNGGGLRVRADGTLGAANEPFAADKITLNNNAVLLSAGGIPLVIGANHGITLGSGGGTIWQFGTAAMVINSPITGAGALTIADDSGAVFLANDNNAWAGGTTINSNAAGRGILSIGAGGATGSLPDGDVLFNSGAGLARLLIFKSTDTILDNNINGPGQIYQIGSGTTTLTGNNTTNQTTFVAGGRLKADFTNPSKTPIGTGTGLQISAGAFEYLAPAGDNTLRLGALTGTAPSNGGLFAGAMVGGGIGDAVVQSTYGGSGNQTLLFNGIARGSAGVTVNFLTNGGVNGVTNSIKFQSGPAANAPMGAAFYFNGSEFAALDTNGFVRPINQGSDANTSALNSLASNQYAKLTNTINGQAAISVSAINLSGANASLNMAANAALTLNANPGGLLKSNGGTSVIGGDAGATVSNNNQELIIRTDSAADTLQIDIPITGTGTVTKSGLGQLTLTGTNTYTGATLLTQGTLLLTGAGQLGTSASSTGEIRIATAAGQSATLAIDSPTAGITMANAANALRVGEAGTGFVNQSAGTVNVSNYLTIGESLGATGTYNISGGTLNVKTNTGTPPAGAAGQNNLVVGRVGTGSLNISGSATVNVLNGAQLMLGMGTNNSGQFQGMTPNAGLSTGVGTITQTGGTVNVSTGNGTYQSNVLGAVIVGVDGAGTYNLNGGTLATPILGRGNGTANFNLGGGTLKATASTMNVDMPINLTGSGAAKGTVDTNGNDLTFSGALRGTGGLVKAGAGALTVLNANSDFSGGTDISAGAIVASGNSLGAGQVNVGSGGTLTVQGVQQGLLAKFYLANAMSVTPAVQNGNAAMFTDFSSLENFNAFTAGKAPVAVESTAARGKLTVDYLEGGGSNGNSALPPSVIALNNGGNPFVANLSGKFNAPTSGEYTFQTRSDDGSMLWIDGQPVLDNNRSQGQTNRTGTIMLSAGAHDIVVGYAQGSGGFGFSVGVTLPNQGQSFTIGSELNMSNSLLSYGNDRLTIGSLTGSGTVQLGSGTLEAGSDDSSTTFSGSITGTSGSIVKQGIGTMTLAGLNTYTGPTIVEKGTLSVGAGGSIGGSDVTVKGGAKLTGLGTIGSLTALSGSNIVPGLGAGQIDVLGDLSLNAGSTLTLELGNTQGAGGPALSDHDSLDVTGKVTLGGNLNVSLLNAGVHFASNTGDVFYIILNDGADAVSGTFNGLPQGAMFTAPNGMAFYVSYTADSSLLNPHAGFASTTGNDVALMAVPEPGTATALLVGMSLMTGIHRFRRRRSK
ncbi:autotransporter-associated beta strand repeat-containing protein [Verrucomicrobiota bacterium sgz303538]